jgi:hypothetical protein
MSFAESAFAQFMSRTEGRILRVVVGLAMIAWGFTHRGQTAGMVLLVVGFVPLVLGTFNLCLISLLLGGPFAGTKILASKRP